MVDQHDELRPASPSPLVPLRGTPGGIALASSIRTRFIRQWQAEDAEWRRQVAQKSAETQERMTAQRSATFARIAGQPDAQWWIARKCLDPTTDDWLTERSPTPWRIEPRERDFVILDADNAEVARLQGPTANRHAPNLLVRQGNARLIAAAPAFLSACTKISADGCSTNLEWLGSLLADQRETGFDHCEDPEACWAAHTAAEELLNDLRAAVRQAQGEQP